VQKKLTFITVLLAVGLFVLFGVALGGYAANALSRETPVAVCSTTMANVIASAKGNVYKGIDPNFVDPTSYPLATYSVSGNEIANPTFPALDATDPSVVKDEQKNSTLQTEAWRIFTKLIPIQRRGMVAQYDVFTDGFENTLAAVDQTKADPMRWILQIDVADVENKNSFMFTLVHEYSHLLTLNAAQVTPDQEIVNAPDDLALQARKAAACPNYFTGTGCSHADSYIHVFYNRFWAGAINDEWKKVDALQINKDNLAPYYDGLYNLYQKHQDQFVDDYAVTYLTEDISESFTYFIFSPKPTGNSIKEQKISFFYEYPELIQLRENILNGACSAGQ